MSARSCISGVWWRRAQPDWQSVDAPPPSTYLGYKEAVPEATGSVVRSTVDIETALQAIDRETLNPLVRKALDSETVAVTDWHYCPLYGGSYGDSALYRWAGKAHDPAATERIPWSIILKIVSRRAELDSGTREARAYQSGLLADLPGGMAAAHCLAVEERAGYLLWMWLEELTDYIGQPWPLSRYRLAARHLGRFNGAYLTGRPLPADPWLSRGFLRAWVTRRATSAAKLPGIREHPLVRRAFPPAVADGVMRLWRDMGPLFDALDQLPQTLCHLDANPANLFARRGADGQEQTVAIDWSCVGAAPLGVEIVSLVSSGLMRGMIELAAAQELDELVFADYLAGLCEAGWQGEPRVVRFGYTAASALRYLLAFAGGTISAALREHRHALEEQRHGRPIEEIMDREGEWRRFLLVLADEAWELLPALR